MMTFWPLGSFSYVTHMHTARHGGHLGAYTIKLVFGGSKFGSY